MAFLPKNGESPRIAATVSVRLPRPIPRIDLSGRTVGDGSNFPRRCSMSGGRRHLRMRARSLKGSSGHRANAETPDDHLNG